jgi:rod shape-determining protein MreC
MDRSIKIGSSQRRSPVLVTIFLIAAILLIALDRAGMLGDTRVRITSFLTPALTAVHQASTTVSEFFVRSANPSQQELELAALREENSRLKAENLQVAQLNLEVVRLRQQVRIEAERPWQLIGTDISSFGVDAARRQVLLAIGSDQGVRPGMAVIAGEGSSPPALIGIVEEVGPQSARVLLITDFTSAVTGRIYRADRTIDGVIQGQWQRGSRIRLEEIPREELISIGDVVVTAGLSAAFGADLPRAPIPPNIPIGIVEQVQTVGQSQQADVRPFVDSDRIRYAWVILSGGD